MKIPRWIALLAIGSLAGCAASITPTATSKEDSTRLAAYAATANPPPATEPSDLHVAVLVRGPQVRLINFTDHPIRNSDVWINGTFVHHIDILPPMQSVTVLKSAFFNKAGQSFDSADVPARKVTLQIGNGMNTTLGPINE